jgi:MFS family permease
MSESIENSATVPAKVARESSLTRIALFLSVAYFAEGACGPFGLVSQPLLRLAKDQEQFSATLISLNLSVLGSPWLIKPLYGAVSDLLPIFNYRRKSYLIAANLLVVIAYTLLSVTFAWNNILALLFLVSLGMAISSSVCGGLLVESGQHLRTSGVLVNYQWLWLNLALILSAFGAGLLAEIPNPIMGVHVAALILTVPALFVILASVFLLVEERRAYTNVAARKVAFSVISAVRSGPLIVLVVFIFFYTFSPGFNVPLYFHMTSDLHFSQKFIGTLNAVASAGSVFGAVLYRIAFVRIKTSTMLYFTIIFGILGTLSYVFLYDSVTAVAIYFSSGIIGVVTIITLATLLADFCPGGSEAFSFGILAAVENLALRVSDVSGSFIYDHVTFGHFVPLVIVSAAFTAFALFLVPFLRLGSKTQGEPFLWQTN